MSTKNKKKKTYISVESIMNEAEQISNGTKKALSMNTTNTTNNIAQKIILPPAPTKSTTTIPKSQIQQQVVQFDLQNKINNQTKLSQLKQNTRPVTSNIIQTPEYSKNYFSDGYQIGDVTKQLINASEVTTGTALDIGTNLLKGGVQIAEGTAKATAFVTTQIAKMLGDEKRAEGIKNSITDDKLSLTKKIDDWQKRTIDKYSISGNIADELVQSIGYTGSLMVTNGIGGDSVNNALMFLSSAGESVAETYQKNPEAKDWEVWLRSGGKGAITVFTEGLGGILGKNKAIGNLEDKAYQKITENMLSGAGKVLTKMGIDATSEMAEEFIEYSLDQLLDAGMDKITGDNKYYEKWDWESVGKDMAMAFASTILLNGTVNVSQVLSVKNEYREKGLDITTPEAIAVVAYRTDMATRQQNNQIELAETQRQIAEKQEQLKTTDQRGREVTQKALEELQQNYNNAIQETRQNVELNESNTRYQSFIQSAQNNDIDINDNSTKTIFEVADKRGVKVTFDSSKFTSENQNAYWQKNDDGTREIFLNPNSTSKKYVENIIVHEMTHDMEGTEEYNILKKAVLDYSMKQEGFDEAYKEIISEYSTKEAESEFVASVLGEKLGNQEFIDELVNSTPKSKIRKVIDWIGSFINKLTGNRIEKLYWQDVKNKFEKAYNAKPVAPIGKGVSIKHFIETVANYDENEYNNTKEKQLPKREYAILSSIVNSDSNIKPGINLVETTNARYTVYFKETGEFKVISKEIEENEGRIDKRNDTTGRARRYSKTFSQYTSNQRTTRSNDEVSNINTRGTHQRGGSNTSSTTTSRYNITKNSNEQSSFSMQENKKQQLEIIKNSNPMLDDYHTGIRNIEDIKTFEETLQDSDWVDYDEFDPDYTREMAEEAIKTGKITVYSSYPIEQGVFVTPSKMEAQDYSRNGKVYSKVVNLKDVAWIDPTQGQYAKTEDRKYSKELTPQTELRLKGNGLNPFDTTRDNEGRKVSKKTQDYFKNTKVRDEFGKLITVYHTTTDSVAQFNEFNPVGTPGYRFGNQVVNYFTNSKDMSGSYANQNYNMADTKKITNMNDVNKYLDTLNKNNTDGNKYDIQKISGINYVIEKSEIDTKALNFLKSLSDKEMQELKDNIYIDSDFTGSAYEKVFSWDKFSKELNDKYQELTKEYVGTEKLVDIQKRMIHYLEHTEKFNDNKVYGGNLIGAYETEEELFRNLKEDIQKTDWTNNSRLQYQGYLNIENPYIIDAEGHNWDRVSIEYDKNIEKVINSIVETQEDKNKLYKLAEESYEKYLDYRKSKEFNEYNDCKNLSTYFNSTKLRKVIDECAMFGFTYSDYIKDEIGNLPSGDTKVKDVNSWFDNLPNDWAKYLEEYGEITLDEYVKKYAKSYKADMRYGQVYSYFNDNMFKTLGKDPFKYYEDLKEKNITPYVFYNLARQKFDENSYKSSFGEAQTTNDIVKKVIEMNKNGANYDGVIIRNTIDYGGYAETHEKADLYVTFNSNQFKSVDNKAPTSDNDIRYSQNFTGAMQRFLDKYARSSGTGKTMQQIKLLTQVKISDFENVLNNATNIPDTEKEELKKNLNNIQLNKNALNDFKNFVIEEDNNYKKLASQNSSTNELSGYSQATYAKYMKKNTDYDRSSLDNAKIMIPANNQGRRTKEQWLSVAKQIGVEIFDKTDSEIEEIAYRTWQDERPNQKDVLNRQGKGYVEFRSNEWVQAVYDSVNEQRKYSKEIDNNKVQLSEKERLKRDSENFSKQVDDYISGNLKSSDYLNLGKTPKLLQDIGLPDEPISMKQSKLKSIMTETDNWNDRNHGLTVDIVKRIPEAISKPLNILKSSTVENSIVIVTDLADKLERPVIVSIEINKRGQIGNVEFMSNRLTSAYGKDNYDRFMKTEIAKGNLLYDIDEGIIKELPASTRLQLSEGLNSLADTVDNVSATNNIIPQSDNKMQENVVDSSSVQKEKVAVILEQPQPRDRKNNVIDILKANVIDKGIVFEELDDQVWKKTKKRTQKLQSRWDYLLLARQRGQHAIGNRRYEFIKGNQVEVSKSLEEIIKEVGSSPKEFYEYMYHQLNIDRMSLESRAQKQLLENKDNLSKKEIKQLEETKNKPVFGNSITAEISMKKVAKLEEKHPEFKKYAQDVYNYLKADKMELVKNGVISQELSDKFEELYPHYVPISRVNRNGKTINVPLDTGRTGINNPIKRATGGNSDIKPLFETMAERTGQIYTASARNSLGLELKNTLAQLGTLNQQAEQTDLDTIIDTVSNEDSEIVKAGTKDNNPTFTVFENGEKKRFDITENIYSALKPVEADYLLNKRIPVLGKINDVRRALITEYNIAFALTNPIKDLQDVVMHSEHSFRTYWETPEAIGSILKKGYWYNEYIQNGGSSNSYFKDGEFDIKQKQPAPVSKVIKLPLEAISKLNNAIEMTPRLAEYIASRKRNCDVQTAMLHASRVTTNFKAGGDFVKFLNRNGATFLNASVQGTVQTVRDIKRANQKGLIGIGYLILRTAIAGIPPYLIMKALWGDDDDYENLSEYAKDNYYIIGKYGDGHFIRIPKGRILASVQKIVANVDEYLNDDKEINIDNVTKDLFTDLKFAWDNMAPNSVSENNLIAPIKQAIKNESWYGEDIIPTRLQDMPAREQYDETIDAFSKFVGETLNISPFKVNYVVDQYSGVIGDVLLPLSTQQAENGLEGIGRILSPLYDKFTVDSKMKNQNVSDIYDLSEKLTVNANSSKASDMDILKSKYINSVTKEMSELYKQKREIQNSNLSDKEKYEEARGVQEQINSLAEIGLSKYENIKIEGNYADVNGVDYYKKDGSWKKLSDKESETLDSLKLNNIEKEYYLNLKNKTSQIEQDYDEKADSLNENSLTYEDDMNDIKNNKKTEIINKISNSSLDEESKIELYKTNFSSSSDTIDRIHKLEIDIDSYMKYSIQDFQADYNVFGKPISGSRKDKVINYLLNMDIPEIQRAILLRKEYPSDESYVYDIVNYIDNLTISYQDKKDLLEYLNFKVEGNSISWD